MHPNCTLSHPHPSWAPRPPFLALPRSLRPLCASLPRITLSLSPPFHLPPPTPPIASSLPRLSIFLPSLSLFISPVPQSPSPPCPSVPPSLPPLCPSPSPVWVPPQPSLQLLMSRGDFEVQGWGGGAPRGERRGAAAAKALMRPPLLPSRRDLNSLFSLERPLIGLGRAPLLAQAPSLGAEDTWILLQHLWPCPSVPLSTCLSASPLGSRLPSSSLFGSRYPICAPLHLPSCLSSPCWLAPPWACLSGPSLCGSSSLHFSCISCHLRPATPFLRSCTCAPVAGSHHHSHHSWGPRPALAYPLRPHSRRLSTPSPPQPCPTTWPRSRKPARQWNS